MERRTLPTGTVEKALDVLAQLQRARGALGVSEIGRTLSMPKTSVHRLLASLARRGYVEPVGDGRYRLGFALVSLGLAVLEREPVIEAARPVLEAEARALGETLFLAAARLGAIVVLDKVEGTGLLRAAPRVGDSAPVHATAVGKLYLAWAPHEVGGVPASLARFTPRTLHTPAALARAVEAVRRRGWASSREEWIAGLVFVAAPVRVADRLLAAVVAAVPTAHVARGGEERLAQATLRAARATAQRMEGGST